MLDKMWSRATGGRLRIRTTVKDLESMRTWATMSITRAGRTLGSTLCDSTGAATLSALDRQALTIISTIRVAKRPSSISSSSGQRLMLPADRRPSSQATNRPRSSTVGRRVAPHHILRTSTVLFVPCGKDLPQFRASEAFQKPHITAWSGFA
jgi:hypothetical protein